MTLALYSPQSGMTYFPDGTTLSDIQRSLKPQIESLSKHIDEEAYRRVSASLGWRWVFMGGGE